jgi:hypothetical protein
MPKLGKNVPCPCGSGKKVKKCQPSHSVSNTSVSPSVHPEEFWRLEYGIARHLRHLTKSELVQRGSDIISNMPKPREVNTNSSNNAKNIGYWMRLAIQIIEEMRLRGNTNSSFLAELDAAMITDLQRVQVKDGVRERIEERKLTPGKYLVKYGNSTHLMPMLEKGIFRIAPATTYDDPSLNAAIQDNELEVSTLVQPEMIKYEDFYKKIKVSAGDRSGYLGDMVEFLGNFKSTRVNNLDFYVFCLCFEHSFRMFDDFGADSCLLITKPEMFIETILHGFEQRLPKLIRYSSQVKYYDPLSDKLESLPPYFAKHFRYYYQNEYRIVWLPSSSVEPRPLDYIHLELGALDNCCELIHLK